MFAGSSGADVMKENLQNYFYSVCVGGQVTATVPRRATFILLQVCVFVRLHVCVHLYIYTLTYKGDM